MNRAFLQKYCFKFSLANVSDYPGYLFENIAPIISSDAPHANDVQAARAS